MRRLVLERDGHRCHWCGGPADQADHLHPRALGGGPALDNYVAACGRCNASRGATLGNAMRSGRMAHPAFTVAAGAAARAGDELEVADSSHAFFAQRQDGHPGVSVLSPAPPQART